MPSSYRRPAQGVSYPVQANQCPAEKLAVGLDDELDRILKVISRLFEGAAAGVGAWQLLGVADPPVAVLLGDGGEALHDCDVMFVQLGPVITRFPGGRSRRWRSGG